ncbi:MAG: RDD family protein [Candidatus Competibacteraceae bacterium]|nr:RDD family protein [Candidatus Competibacteraceae bacterium]
MLAYFTGLSNDFASGFFTIDAVFAGLLAIFLLSLLNAVFPGCISILAFFALLASAGDFSVDDLSPRHYLFVQIVFLLAPLAYNVILEKIFHTTIGKWLMGLGLNLYGEDGNRLKTEPGWLNLMAREVLRMLYIDFVLPWWYPLSFAFKWKRSERMLYDRLALTGVVEEVVEKEPGQSAFYRKRAQFVLFTAGGAMLSLLYLGVLQEPVHLALNKIYLKVAKIG